MRSMRPISKFLLPSANQCCSSGSWNWMSGIVCFGCLYIFWLTVLYGSCLLVLALLFSVLVLVAFWLCASRISGSVTVSYVSIFCFGAYYVFCSVFPGKWCPCALYMGIFMLMWFVLWMSRCFGCVTELLVIVFGLAVFWSSCAVFAGVCRLNALLVGILALVLFMLLVSRCVRCAAG